MQGLSKIDDSWINVYVDLSHTYMYVDAIYTMYHVDRAGHGSLRPRKYMNTPSSQTSYMQHVHVYSILDRNLEYLTPTKAGSSMSTLQISDMFNMHQKIGRRIAT